MLSKYLTDLGIKKESTPWGWGENDERQSQWQKERDIYEFDERETWGLDYTFYLLMYPRLKMYDEINCIDTDMAYDIRFNGRIYTLQGVIDTILEGWEIALIAIGVDKLSIWELSEEKQEKINKANRMFARYIHKLWW